MEWYKNFFANICTLVTLTYLASWLNKYLFKSAGPREKEFLFIITAALSGWVSMFFGLRVGPTAMFDLRFVPLIVGFLFVRNSWSLVLIGILIGLTRLTFGLTTAAWVGLTNMVILGLVCAFLHQVLRHSSLSTVTRVLVMILTVNAFNVVDIALLGVIPPYTYLTQIAPKIFPLSVLLSAFFAGIVRDFQTDYWSRRALRIINSRLSEQNRIAEQRTHELIKTQQELEEKARLVMLSSRYKSEFLANMSHELRTPLNSLLLLSQMLADNPNRSLLPEEVKFAQLIHRSGNELLELINDILDLSKVEAGKMEINRDPVNLSELPEIMESSFRPIAASKGLGFEIHCEPGAPALIFTDQQRLQQVLRNLLSNAFKFTEKGTVTLTVKPVSELDSLPDDTRVPPHWIAITVADTGIGIAPDKQKLVFEPFQQADGTMSRKYGGTGLGLSISREFARLLGGFIKLESTVGQGSAFTLYLPASLPDEPWVGLGTANEGPHPGAAEAEAAAFEQAAAYAAPSLVEAATEALSGNEAAPFSLEGRTILVVDDDERNVFTITAALNKKNARVLTASNGQQALQTISGQPDVDLVLMDIMMPEMNGFEAIRRIRQQPSLEKLPVVAFTALALKGDEQKCLEAGASDYVSKPLHMDRLLAVLQRWLPPSRSGG